MNEYGQCTVGTTIIPIIITCSLLLIILHNSHDYEYYLESREYELNRGKLQSYKGFVNSVCL